MANEKNFPTALEAGKLVVQTIETRRTNVCEAARKFIDETVANEIMCAAKRELYCVRIACKIPYMGDNYDTFVNYVTDFLTKNGYNNIKFTEGDEGPASKRLSFSWPVPEEK